MCHQPKKGVAKPAGRFGVMKPLNVFKWVETTNQRDIDRYREILAVYPDAPCMVY
jgi:hypothetical protein